jgi:HSP20 family protein
MVSKYRDRASGRGHGSSEAEHYLTVLPNSQWMLTRHGQVWRPPTDVYETDEGIVVKVEVAGMSEDDFSIVFSEHTLVINGIRHDTSTKRGYYQMEIPYGQFRTEVYVTETIDPEDIEARYKNGFLLVTLPRRKARRVKIHPQETS